MKDTTRIQAQCLRSEKLTASFRYEGMWDGTQVKEIWISRKDLEFIEGKKYDLVLKHVGTIGHIMTGEVEVTRLLEEG